MKIKKPEGLDSVVSRTEQQRNKNLDPNIKSRAARNAGEEVGRVDIALGRELNNIAESTNPKVADLKKIFEAKGVKGLNALYDTKDVAAAFANEVGSFVNDFSERE